MERKHNPKLTENAKELRKNTTREEKHLWYDFLKDCPVSFLRRKVIDNYIADFYRHKARLIIELERDLTVLRIPNGEINHNFEGICRFIDEFVKESLRQLSADPFL